MITRFASGPAAPELTVAIPTYNRAGYLAVNLAQLASELQAVDACRVEILVSDNCSTDSTPSVVEAARADGLNIRYVRNERNLGWGPNFAQCFALSSGKYTLLLGDDDVLVDGALSLLLDRLQGNDYGVVTLRPFGFDRDFRAEYPGSFGHERRFSNASNFLTSIGALMTLTSSNVINKRLIGSFDMSKYVSGDLAALPLVLRAALGANENLFIDKYLIGGKRNNSFAYEYSQVFVTEMWNTIDEHIPLGLSREAVRTLERNMLFAYYPYYMLDVRLNRRSDPKIAYSNFARRFKGRVLFDYWLAPTTYLPRPFALVWGAMTTLLGRGLGGEFRRGVAFAFNKIRRPTESSTSSVA